MSQTRSEVLSLLKQFDHDFTVFDGPEESFILDLVRGRLSSSEQHNVDWQRLSKAYFVLRYCCVVSGDGSLRGAPQWFLKQARESYWHQVSANEPRIVQIQTLARLFDEAGVKVLFLKGAAELAYCPDDIDFLGRRYMCDIDLLCGIQDLDRVDELVRSIGYELWDHGLKHWTREQISKYSLSRHSHYIYDVDKPTYMEVHGHVAAGANRASYPPDFETLLIDQSRQVDVGGTQVWVPKPEHLLVHTLCHAASKNNIRELVYLDRFQLDEFAATNCVVSPPMQVNRRLDISQLRFSLKLRDLLLRFDGCLNFSEIRELFLQVEEKDLNEMYVMVASYIFNERFPVMPEASLETIRMSRQRYVSRFMVPLLAERIESIITNRLQQVTDAYIEQQVERIAVSVERRVIHSVTERMLDSAKSFVGKGMRRVLPRPFRTHVK